MPPPTTKRPTPLPPKPRDPDYRPQTYHLPRVRIVDKGDHYASEPADGPRHGKIPILMQAYGETLLQFVDRCERAGIKIDPWGAAVRLKTFTVTVQ